MVPDGNLVTINGLILLNNVVALVGYWLAAHLIDMGWYVHALQDFKRVLSNYNYVCSSFFYCGPV